MPSAVKNGRPPAVQNCREEHGECRKCCCRTQGTRPAIRVYNHSAPGPEGSMDNHRPRCPSQDGQEVVHGLVEGRVSSYPMQDGGIAQEGQKVAYANGQGVPAVSPLQAWEACQQGCGNSGWSLVRWTHVILKSPLCSVKGGHGSKFTRPVNMSCYAITGD